MCESYSGLRVLRPFFLQILKKSFFYAGKKNSNQPDQTC